MKSNELLRKPNRKFVIGATLVVLAILHFTFSRFIAIEIEKDSTEIEAANAAAYQPAPPAAKTESASEIAQEREPIEPETVTAAAPIASIRKTPPRRTVQPQTETRRETEKETPIVKKKAIPTESRAERLRRAEKMLTGV